jgi:hypothetical protein
VPALYAASTAIAAIEPETSGAHHFQRQLAGPVSAPEQIRYDLIAADELEIVALARDLLQTRAEARLREEDDPQVAGQPRPRLAQRGDLVGLELFEHAQAKLAVLPLGLTDDDNRRR